MVPRIKLSEAFSLYESDYIAFKGQSGKTGEAYQATAKTLINRFGDVSIEGLGFNDIRDWKLWLDKGRQPNTVRGYIVCLRVLLRFLRRRGYSVLDPDDIPIPKRIYTEVEYLTEDEMDEFIQEVGKPCRGYAKSNRLRNVAMITLLYATGLRNAEICALNRNSIKNRTFTVIGKGNKPRIGFVDVETMKMLDDYLATRTDSNPALFISEQTGKRITPGTFRRVFTFACARSAFQNVHPHTIRHSFATKLMLRGVNIRFVQEILGHTSLATTQMYTHVINEDLKAVYDKAMQF